MCIVIVSLELRSDSCTTSFTLSVLKLLLPQRQFHRLQRERDGLRGEGRRLLRESSLRRARHDHHGEHGKNNVDWSSFITDRGFH